VLLQNAGHKNVLLEQMQKTTQTKVSAVE